MFPQVVSFLLINYSHVTDLGLMSGKMGGVLFFISYARKIRGAARELPVPPGILCRLALDRSDP